MKQHPGEKVSLDSGVKVLGSPPARVSWFKTAGIGGEVTLVADGSQILEYVTVAERSTTFFSVVVTQCKKEWVTMHEIQPDAEEIINPELPDGLEEFASCSILPGGVVDNFYSVTHQLDLACTHVLSSNVFSRVPWFVYGTFDVMEGDLALSAMTVYVGATIFEFQRGWIINLDGRKYPVMEGDDPAVFEYGAGHCSVEFKDNHLHAHCEDLFEVFYDGVMAGHVRLLPSLGKGVESFQQEAGSFGLCWSYESGRRANWQVGRTKGACKVDNTGPIEDCSAEKEEECVFPKMTFKVFMYFPMDISIDVPSFSDCGVGAGVACHELSCQQEDLTPMQRCSINQAYHLGCDLKFLASKDVSVEFESIKECPDLCEWRQEVVKRGCPQAKLPYDVCA
eukprot:sb/3465476/